MKKFFYSNWVSFILFITMLSLTFIYWSIPMIILYAIFYIFYYEKAKNWRKFKKSQKL